MNCTDCGAANASDARFCVECGRPFRGGSELGATEHAGEAAPPGAPLPPESASNGLPEAPSTAETAAPPGAAAPIVPEAAAAPTVPETGAVHDTVPMPTVASSTAATGVASGSEHPGRRSWLSFAVVASIAAVAMLAAGGLLLFSRSDSGSSAPATDPNVTSGGEDVAAEVATSAAVTATTLSGDIEVAPTTTITSTTTTTTTTATSTTTTLPPPPPISGPGNALMLVDPLPSGLPAADVDAALGTAQQLADALALDNWAAARAIETLNPPKDDTAYSTGYDGLDRASLLLVDAYPEGGGHRLLLVSVANEKDGAQTTLWCVEWTADPWAGTVQQNSGAVGNIHRVPYTLSPEQIATDPTLNAIVWSECHW